MAKGSTFTRLPRPPATPLKHFRRSVQRFAVKMRRMQRTWSMIRSKATGHALGFRNGPNKPDYRKETAVRPHLHDLLRRFRYRRDRDELRDARLALSQSLFRQRHLHLGFADLDRAGGALRRIFHRRDR